MHDERHLFSRHFKRRRKALTKALDTALVDGRSNIVWVNICGRIWPANINTQPFTLTSNLNRSCAKCIRRNPHTRGITNSKSSTPQWTRSGQNHQFLVAAHSPVMNSNHTIDAIRESFFALIHFYGGWHFLIRSSRESWFMQMEWNPFTYFAHDQIRIRKLRSKWNDNLKIAKICMNYKFCRASATDWRSCCPSRVCGRIFNFLVSVSIICPVDLCNKRGQRTATCATCGFRMRSLYSREFVLSGGSTSPSKQIFTVTFDNLFPPSERISHTRDHFREHLALAYAYAWYDELKGVCQLTDQP